MMTVVKILAISGSTRKNSANLRLLNAITDLFSDRMKVTIFNGLYGLPPFNPDDNNEHVAKSVSDFREQIRNANGVIICTPEYAHGVPGSLKNAIDWTVSTNEFWKKPTALITASTDGRFGHKALLETLRVIEAENIDELNLLIQFINTKVDEKNKIKDPQTLKDIHWLMNNLITTIHKQKREV